MNAGPPQLALQTVRGLGCLLLVAYHVVGSTPQAGLRLPAESGWHYVMTSADLLRMPLFAVLSGYLYALRRPSLNTVRSFALAKLRRIVVPLVFATLVTFWLRDESFGSDVTLAHALFYHYQHFWFLQALMLIFAFMAACDLVWQPGWRALLAFAVVALVLERSVALTEFLSLDGAVYLLPFFCFGMILKLHPKLMLRRDLRIGAMLVLGIVILSQQAGLLLGTAAISRYSFPAAMAGCAFALLLLIHMPRLSPLESIGRYSYGIYLWHSICAAAVRTWVNAALILPTGAQFLVVVFAAVALPIVLQLLVQRFPLLPTLMMGQRCAPIRWPARESVRETPAPQP